MGRPYRHLRSESSTSCRCGRYHASSLPIATVDTYPDGLTLMKAFASLQPLTQAVTNTSHWFRLPRGAALDLAAQVAANQRGGKSVV